MKKEYNKNIDHVFKDKLEDPIDEIGYQGEDWNALEKMLDADKNKGRIVFWRPLLTGVAAIILLALGLMFFKGGLTGSTQKPVQQVATVKLPQAHTTPQPANAIVKPSRVATNSIGTAMAQSDPVVQQQQRALHPKLKSKPQQQSTGGQYLADDKINAGKSTDRGVQSASGQPASIANNPDINTNQKADNNQVQVVNTGNNPLLAASKTVQATASADTANSATNVSADADHTDMIAAKKTAIKKNTGPYFRPQYSISIVGAPEINGVGTLNGASNGFNIGLLFTAEVFKKVTITTGLNYSKKPYSLGFGDYKTAYVFKQNPDYVSADCRLLDIPLNIGYQLYGNSRNKITVGTGLSSYIMTHENYQFNYQNATGVSLPAGYAVKNPGSYLFSIMNLEASYQYQIDRNVGISIQPYLKVPLAGIGYSQIKMESGGVALGLHWNINPKTKPK